MKVLKKTVATGETIMLGAGDKLVSDVALSDDGLAGFIISDIDGGNGIGAECHHGCKYDDELGYMVRVLSSDPRSLDVIIDACKRAKANLKEG